MPASTFTIAVGKWQEAKPLPHNNEKQKREEPRVKSDWWVITSLRYVTWRCLCCVVLWNLWHFCVTAETLIIQKAGLRAKAVKTKAHITSRKMRRCFAPTWIIHVVSCTKLTLPRWSYLTGFLPRPVTCTRLNPHFCLSCLSVWLLLTLY